MKLFTAADQPVRFVVVILFSQKTTVQKEDNYDHVPVHVYNFIINNVQCKMVKQNKKYLLCRFVSIATC